MRDRDRIRPTSHSAAVVAPIEKLAVELRAYLTKNELLPIAGSKAERERSVYPHPEYVYAANASAALALATAIDHCSAVALVLMPGKACVFPPFVLVRALMEKCALAVWLSDEVASAHDRASRYVAWRFSGLTEQGKAIAETTRGEQPHLEVLRRIDQFVNEAIRDGFEEIFDKKGARIGVGTRMPGRTELIGSTIELAQPYRLYSGVAHGEQYALINVGITIVKMPDERPEGVINLGPEKALALAAHSATCLTRASSSIAAHFGWDTDELSDILDPALHYFIENCEPKQADTGN